MSRIVPAPPCPHLPIACVGAERTGVRARVVGGAALDAVWLSGATSSGRGIYASAVEGRWTGLGSDATRSVYTPLVSLQLVDPVRTAWTGDDATAGAGQRGW